MFEISLRTKVTAWTVDRQKFDQTVRSSEGKLNC